MHPSKPSPRIVNLHGTFVPDGGHEKDHVAFFEFWLAGHGRLTALQNKDLRRRKAEFAKFRKFVGKVGPVFRQIMRNELSPAEAGQKIKLLVPDEKLRREVFDYWAKVYQTTPEQVEKSKKEIAQEEEQITHDEKILAASKTISHSVTQLHEMAVTGDEAAAKALLQAAYLPGLAVSSLEKQQRDMMERIARRETVWPVLTDGKPGWEKLAAERLTKLHLGADMTSFRVRFRQPRGAEVNLPARKWTKAAVRSIEDTRFRHLVFGGLLKGFESAGAMADFILETGWDYGDTPDWLGEVCKLEAFSMESLPAWKRAVRKMIRQQLPDFHERLEWATQRASAVARGRGTPGEIRNAILDDICSALERIAPPANLPKSGC